MLTQELVIRFFNYEPETGILTRRISGKRSRKGDECGCYNAGGYTVVYIDGKQY